MASDLCGKPATHRVFWPGREPMSQCKEHTNALLRVARAMGLPLYTEPTFLPDETCTQHVKEPTDGK